VGTRNLDGVYTKPGPGDRPAELDSDCRVVQSSDGWAGESPVATSTRIDGPTGRANSAGEALESPPRVLQVTVGVEAPARRSWAAHGVLGRGRLEARRSRGHWAGAPRG
jgi:hypothetical protein